MTTHADHLAELGDLLHAIEQAAISTTGECCDNATPAQYREAIATLVSSIARARHQLAFIVHSINGEALQAELTHATRN